MSLDVLILRRNIYMYQFVRAPSLAWIAFLRVESQLQGQGVCLTWFHALVGLWRFCLLWLWHRLSSSGSEGEGKLRFPLSAPHFPGVWQWCFVSEQISQPQSPSLKKRDQAIVIHLNARQKWINSSTVNVSPLGGSINITLTPFEINLLNYYFLSLLLLTPVVILCTHSVPEQPKFTLN